MSRRSISPVQSSSGDSPDVSANVKRRTVRCRRSNERMEWLARPAARRLRSLWDENCAVLAPHRRDNVKSALEEDYFMTPEQTEEYFRGVRIAGAAERRRDATKAARREHQRRAREVRLRQKWLVSFSAQIAYRLCDYVARGQKEMLVTNRLKSIADVVLERVAEILGEPKPSRTCGTRLARFMVAISDRIAVWIENTVYRSDALELMSASRDDEIETMETPTIAV